MLVSYEKKLNMFCQSHGILRGRFDFPEEEFFFDEYGSLMKRNVVW